MAAASGRSASSWDTPGVYKHHEKRNICISRPKYREGRRDRAVKVYTINLESRYVMIQGVPAIGVMTELIQLCALYGTVEEYRPLDEYPAEEFTEVYLVKFQKLTGARAAKRHMDETSFYGGVLHVCYVPEYESVEDTRLKLLDRRSYVMRAAQNKAREKAKEATGHEEPTRSNTAKTSENFTPRNVHKPTNTPKTSESITSRNVHKPNNDNPGPNSTLCHHSGFPLLPLPPQEQHFHRGRNQNGAVAATEDKMGTLHNAILDPRQHQAHGSSSNQTPSDQEREHRLTSDQAAPRFVPRKTLLENRKRTAEEAPERTLTQTDASVEKGPLFGPRLPEEPKLDMEDESLNTTVTLIRNTMKRVESVPDIKPEVKKKQRRRI